MSIIHISFANIKVDCPYCGKIHIEQDDKWINAINKNVSGVTSSKCDNCSQRFGIASDYKGLVSFSKM